ncbi:MAG: VOC family protein [Alphaproteobacteria bacterium]|nr:VOC family protein [Alphaproteobacteria bacterium]
MSEQDGGGEARFRFRHTMLPVADLERAVDFYTRLLGMQVVRRRDQGDDGRAIAYVGYGPEGTHPVLELIAGTGNADKPWAGHIAIAVADLEALCGTLEREGVRFTRPLTAPEGGTNELVANILDADGFEIELNQRKGGIYN